MPFIITGESRIEEQTKISYDKYENNFLKYK